MATTCATSDVSPSDPGTEEVMLRVPEHLALSSPGFAIDAGGSVTKLLYRSKKDYANGKLIAKAEHNDGILRMRHLPIKSDDELLNFLRDHCDILDSARTDQPWFITGVHTQRFRQRLEEVLQLKVRTLTEMDAIYKGLKGFYSELPDCQPLNLSQAAAEHALETTRGFMQMMSTAQQAGDNSFEEVKAKVDPVVVGQYAAKIMTTDGKQLTEELSHKVFEWPCLNAICGSAAGLIVVKENGGFDIGSFTPVCGKTFLSFGKLMCGAKNYEELIEMAGKGDHRKVDTMTSDNRPEDNREADWYSNLPDSVVTYCMGKMTDDTSSGSWTKYDVAAGLLNATCCSIAKLSIAVARHTKVKCVLFNGSFLNSEVVRSTLQRWLLADSMLQPLIGEEQIKWIFLPHPGFVCAFGTWFRNWELEQERKKK